MVPTLNNPRFARPLKHVRILNAPRFARCFNILNTPRFARSYFIPTHVLGR